MLRFKSSSTKSARLAAAMRKIAAVVQEYQVMCSINLSDGEHLAQFSAFDPDWSAVRFSPAPDDGLAVTVMCKEEDHRSAAVLKHRMTKTVGGLAMLYKGVENHLTSLTWVIQLVQKYMGEVMPETLEEAAELVIDSITEEEKEWAKVTPLTMAVADLHHGFGRQLRNKWNLWQDGPLKAEVQQKWKLFGHGDDLSGLIFAAVWAKLRGEDVPAAIAEEVESYKRHWQREGINPETGGKSIIIP